MARFYKTQWFWGGTVILVFAALLATRMGAFEKHGVDREAVQQAAENLAGTANWLVIKQNGQKIGYAKRDFLRKEDGGFVVTELVFMRIQAMGLAQEVQFTTTGILKPDLTLDRFAFELSSSLFSFKARGEMHGKTLSVFTGENQARTDIPLDEEPYLGSGLMHAAAVMKMEPGDTRSFPVFDPATTGYRPARVTVEKVETVEVLGEPVEAKRVKIDFMGSAQTAWISDTGEVLAEEGPLGIRLEKATVEQALAEDELTGTGEMTEYASVESNVTFPNPQALTLLKVRVEGPAEALGHLNEDRQTFEDGILTIRKETLPMDKGKSTTAASFEGGRTFLETGPFIQTGHPKIQKQAGEIVEPGDSPVEKTRKILDWVYENLEKRPVFSIPEAVSTLENRAGDCNEHAVLTAALARAAGVPARMEIGVVYHQGRFYYHAWNSFYLSGQWVTGDAAFGQFPADATHISFVRGDARSQMDVMGLIGKLKLTVLEHTP